MSSASTPQPGRARKRARAAACSNNTAGNGTPGNGTPGNGTPGNGTPGNGTPGNGTPGNSAAHRSRSNKKTGKDGTKKAYVPSYVQEGEKCMVCGDNSTGTHYRAMTCEGCKGFFRRKTQKFNGEEPNLVCKRDGNCEITPQTRNGCQSCRYKKCLDVKMDRASVLNEPARERLSNLIVNNRKERMKNISAAEWEALRRIANSFKKAIIHTFFKFSFGEDETSSHSPILHTKINAAVWHVYNFARNIPGIGQIEPEDMISLIENRLVDVLVLLMAEIFNTAENERSFMNSGQQERHGVDMFPMFQRISKYVKFYSRFATKDGMVLGCLCAIRLLNCDNIAIKDAEKVEQALDNVMKLSVKFWTTQKKMQLQELLRGLPDFESIREFDQMKIYMMATVKSILEDVKIHLKANPIGVCSADHVQNNANPGGVCSSPSDYDNDDAYQVGGCSSPDYVTRRTVPSFSETSISETSGGDSMDSDLVKLEETSYENDQLDQNANRQGDEGMSDIQTCQKSNLRDLASGSSDGIVPPASLCGGNSYRQSNYVHSEASSPSNSEDTRSDSAPLVCLPRDSDSFTRMDVNRTSFRNHEAIPRCGFENAIAQQFNEVQLAFGNQQFTQSRFQHIPSSPCHSMHQPAPDTHRSVSPCQLAPDTRSIYSAALGLLNLTNQLYVPGPSGLQSHGVVNLQSRFQEAVPSPPDHVPSLQEHVHYQSKHVPSLQEHVHYQSNHVPSLQEHVHYQSKHVPSLQEHVHYQSNHVPNRPVHVHHRTEHVPYRHLQLPYQPVQFPYRPEYATDQPEHSADQPGDDVTARPRSPAKLVAISLKKMWMNRACGNCTN